MYIYISTHMYIYNTVCFVNLFSNDFKYFSFWMGLSQR